MGTDEIKGKLHESIENIDDTEFLLTIKELIDRKYQSTDTPQLSEPQIIRIRESEKQIPRGCYYTDEQADRLIDRWLKE